MSDENLKFRLYKLVNQAISIIDCNCAWDENENPSWELTSGDIGKILGLLLKLKKELPDC